MSQQVKDARVNTLANDPYDNGPLVRDVCEDLLSLRAAVRRVLEADLAATCNHKQPPLLRYALNSLRAEMASLGGNGNGGAS